MHLQERAGRARQRLVGLDRRCVTGLNGSVGEGYKEKGYVRNLYYWVSLRE